MNSGRISASWRSRKGRQLAASVGVGLRLYIPAFGQLPIAFDFAIPIQKEDGDETQVFSFTAELPF